MESSRFSNVITVLALLAYINLISFVNAKMLNLLSRNNSENFILFFDNGDFILETNILLNLENPLLKAYIFPNNVSQNSPLNNEHLRGRKFYSQQSCLHFTKKKIRNLEKLTRLERINDCEIFVLSYLYLANVPSNSAGK